MRWKYEPERPKNGDIRVKRVFAWKKTRIGNYIIWLETYQVTEKYFEPVGGNPGWWSEISKETLDWA